MKKLFLMLAFVFFSTFNFAENLDLKQVDYSELHCGVFTAHCGGQGILCFSTEDSWEDIQQDMMFFSDYICGNN